MTSQNHSLPDDQPLRGDGAAEQSNRGREAERPQDVPRPGWLDIAARTGRQINEDNLGVVAAGVAFYGFLAVVPALGAVVGLYALFADPAQVANHLEALRHVVPGEAMPILRQQITRISQNQHAASLSVAIGLVVALYSSSQATKAMMVGLNVAYNEREKRGFLRIYGTAWALTLGLVVGAVFMLGLMTVLPPFLSSLGWGEGAKGLVNALRWPVVAGEFILGLAVLYRFGPSREAPQWRWLSWGAGFAAILWLIGSAAFSWYVKSFGSYQKTYGSLGAIVVFLLWLMLSAFSALVGAALNCEMERQTRRDTTTGQPRARGERGAYAADTVGPARGATKRGKGRPAARPAQKPGLGPAKA